MMMAAGMMGGGMLPPCQLLDGACLASRPAARLRTRPGPLRSASASASFWDGREGEEHSVTAQERAARWRVPGGVLPQVERWRLRASLSSTSPLFLTRLCRAGISNVNIVINAEPGAWLGPNGGQTGPFLASRAARATASSASRSPHAAHHTPNAACRRQQVAAAFAPSALVPHWLTLA